MDLLDEPDATMSYDFGYGQFVPSRTPYKTIASNPMFMSFADPSPGQTTAREGNSRTGSLDELFGGHIFDAQSPVNFGVLMKSAATSPVSPALTSSMSSITQQSVHTPSAASSSHSSPPFESHDGSSPTVGSMSHAGCPKTRAQFEQHIQAEGNSIFAPPPPQEMEAQTQIFGDVDSPMVVCKGATFPPTEKSDHNIDVLTAWRSIMSHPHFQASVSDHFLGEVSN